MLSRLLDALQERLQTTLPIPDADAEAGASALAWFRAMVTEAEAIRVLGETEHAEAAVSNFRSMFEAWLQLRYLLKVCPDANDAGRQARAFALFEFSDYLVNTGGDADDVRLVEDQLRPLRQHFPAIISEIEARRNPKKKAPGNPNYWSGKGPTQMIKAVQATVKVKTKLADLYKFTSWNPHHVMAPLLNATLEYRADGSIHIQFHPRQTPEEAATHYSGLATQLLMDGWTLLQEKFSWPPLQPAS
jgi:hypothetical protein